MQKAFVTVLLMTALSGCVNWKAEATATEKELCRTWGESLPTRSKQDTDQTKEEITVAYADFANACPSYASMIPE